MPRKPRLKVETDSTLGQLSAWPNLHKHQDKAQYLVGRPEWELFLLDLASHRKVNLERLARTDDEKTGDKIRGAISTIDFILSLPESVENWKKQ
jgi:hypothetical protein